MPRTTNGDARPYGDELGTQLQALLDLRGWTRVTLARFLGRDPSEITRMMGERFTQRWNFEQIVRDLEADPFGLERAERELLESAWTRDWLRYCESRRSR